MKTAIIAVSTFLGGLAVAYLFLSDGSSNDQGASGGDNDEPLYWVAPMDSNYRRDGPGKSPMGMDLVPVYASDASGAGEVRISPAVEHNLGVQTGTVRRGVLTEQIKTVGHVDYDENRIHGVHPRVEGWLTRLYVKTKGEPIVAGDALYDLYSPQLVNAQEEYLTAFVNGNQALIESARERLRSFNVPSGMIDTIEESQAVMQSVTFSAPHGGIVREIDVAEGAFVSPGSRLMTIADLSRVWLTAEIFETDIGSVGPGDEMQYSTPVAPGMIHRASIDFVYPMLEAVTRTLQVRATLDNESGLLRPNMFADLTIPLASPRETLLVPKSAVIRTEDQNRVVVASADGSFKSVAVTIGRTGDRDTEILEGLREGDEIVTAAQFLIDSESSKTSDFQRMSMASAASHDHSQMDPPQMNHSQMDHSQMDHSQMDHSQMDHSQMDHSQMDHGNMEHMDQKNESRMVWVRALIRSVDNADRTMSLTHEPIPAWNWPTMTMTMNAGESVRFEDIEPGEYYRVHMMEAPDSPTGYIVMHIAPDAE